MLRMVQRDTIHAGKTPPRLHYIREWAEKRGMTQADVARKTGADKGLVSRWFNEGVVPGERYLSALVEAFHLDEPVALFRHPDEDWLARFFADRSEDERGRMITALEAAFPRRRA
ncbi:transcriptional regulator with XRE-family HTH domain [Ancylobacter vacuolatus]|uniref:Transcriptional regulator with XRE-family HTH domain n=2 Tax=Ancylobacter vacuolatus TaxID=223389 RepID=A0ABU0DMT6_9HYPH|nr:transcriptional regulator with XRE-family HTH domain [Ancylobacter vacuolatus]